MNALLRTEAAWLRHSRRAVPFGHTLLAVATPVARGTPAGDRRSTRGSGPHRFPVYHGVASFWDQQAEAYDRAYEEEHRGGRILRSRQATALELLRDGPGDLLDVGMGPGRLLGELAERGWRVSGVDASERMVALARRRVPQAAERIVPGELEHLPFPDASFDAVVAIGVLEYAGRTEAALAELARLLRSGGMAVFTLPNAWAPSGLWRRAIAYPLVRAVKRFAPFGRPAPPRRGRPPGRRRVRRMLTSCGLEVESLRGENRVPPTLARQHVYGARKRSPHDATGSERGAGGVGA